MGKIATWSFLNSKFGTSGSPTNKCPRKSDIEATGKVKVSGSYSSNQLVQEANCASADVAYNVNAYSNIKLAEGRNGIAPTNNHQPCIFIRIVGNYYSSELLPATSGIGTSRTWHCPAKTLYAPAGGTVYFGVADISIGYTPSVNFATSKLSTTGSFFTTPASNLTMYLLMSIKA